MEGKERHAHHETHDALIARVMVAYTGIHNFAKLCCSDPHFIKVEPSKISFKFVKVWHHQSLALCGNKCWQIKL